MWNRLMWTLKISKELVSFYVVLITAPLYIQWYQFIIFHVTLPIPYLWVPLNFMLVFKGFLWASWTFWFCWSSRLLLDITLPDPEQFGLFLTQNYQIQPLKTSILWSQLAVAYPSRISPRLSISYFVMSQLLVPERFQVKYSWRFYLQISLT